MKKAILAVSVFILMVTLFSVCKEEKKEVPVAKEDASMENKSLAGKKVVMIIAPENFRDEELVEPKSVLTDQGAEVKVASTSLETARGMLGGETKPDMLTGDIKPEDWDAIVLVGGTGASIYWEDASIHLMLNEAVKQNKIVGAICIAPVTLANAGILSGKKATVSGSETQKLTDKGAQCTGKGVQRDGNIITASGPTAAASFGNVIAKALEEQKKNP